MSKRLMSRLLGMFQSRTQVGVDKAGNRYFTRVEESDGAMKERRWVEFKGADEDPTTVPGIRVDLLVEWPKKESSNTRGKSDSPNLQSFVKQQYAGTSLSQKKGPDEVSRAKDAADTEDATIDNERTSEPTGTGACFNPGTWQPPT